MALLIVVDSHVLLPNKDVLLQDLEQDHMVHTARLNTLCYNAFRCGPRPPTTSSFGGPMHLCIERESSLGAESAIDGESIFPVKEMALARMPEANIATAVSLICGLS